MVTGNGRVHEVRRAPRRDMTIRPFPVLVAEQQPEVVLQRLREWAEGQAEDSVAWYLRDKAIRRTASRILRGCAILLGIAGGVVPLVSAASAGRGASWGYVLLAMAGGCLAFDHFLGCRPPGCGISPPCRRFSGHSPSSGWTGQPQT